MKSHDFLRSRDFMRSLQQREYLELLELLQYHVVGHVVEEAVGRCKDDVTKLHIERGAVSGIRARERERQAERDGDRQIDRERQTKRDGQPTSEAAAVPRDRAATSMVGKYVGS